MNRRAYANIHSDTYKDFVKAKPRKWCHFLLGSESRESTPCGKTSRLIRSTKYMDAVTCPRCLSKLKEDNWFCPEHGFIDDANVTFQETCDECGADCI